MAEGDAVVNEPENSRYVLKRGDEVLGELVYEHRREGEIVFTHTGIEPDAQERGLGSALVRGALDQVRASSDERVAAECPFVVRFLETHEEYQDLTAR